ncbi:MAG: hypothetical protein AVDCRST_MAG30-2399, partial [uncultured Solirubrobacteraceae bacterium]
DRVRARRDRHGLRHDRPVLRRLLAQHGRPVLRLALARVRALRRESLRAGPRRRGDRGADVRLRHPAGRVRPHRDRDPREEPRARV